MNKVLNSVMNKVLCEFGCTKHIARYTDKLHCHVRARKFRITKYHALIIFATMCACTAMLMRRIFSISSNQRRNNKMNILSEENSKKNH